MPVRFPAKMETILFYSLRYYFSGGFFFVFSYCCQMRILLILSSRKQFRWFLFIVRRHHISYGWTWNKNSNYLTVLGIFFNLTLTAFFFLSFFSHYVFVVVLFVSIYSIWMLCHRDQCTHNAALKIHTFAYKCWNDRLLSHFFLFLFRPQ